MRVSKLLVLFGLIVTLPNLVRATDTSIDDEALLFQFEIPARAELSFHGNNPPINEALYKKFRLEAEAQAKKICAKLVGPYTLLAKTAEGTVEQSILHYSFETTYLCGREVNSNLEIVPFLIESLSTTNNFDIADLASEQLVRIGRNAVIPVIDVITSVHVDEETKRLAIRTLGSMCEKYQTGGLQDEILIAMANLMNYGNDMLGYEAQWVFGEAYQASFFAKNNRFRFTELGYARALAGISGKQKVNSSYPVEVSEITPLLKSTNGLVVSYAVNALYARGLKQEEFESLLPVLAQLADPKSTTKSTTIFYVLSADGLKFSDTVAQILVKAVDVSLLTENNVDQGCLFQAMVAMRKMIEFPSTKAAIPALRVIAASTLNPQNDYLQRMAKELLSKLGA